MSTMQFGETAGTQKGVYMNSGSIGIKLADNQFFPILDGGNEGSKILELTTVRENQGSVQIHLYRSKDSAPNQTIDGTEYIGTLIIEDISEKPAGVPTIELKINLDADNNLSAEARDLDSGSRQSLNVSLKTLSQDALEPLPDFDLTDFDGESAVTGIPALDDFDSLGSADSVPGMEDTAADSTPPPEEIRFDDVLEDPDPASAQVPDGLYDRHPAARRKERKGIFLPAWLCVLILVVGIAALAAALLFAWKLFFSGAPDAEKPAVAAVETPAPDEPLPPPPPSPTPVPEPDPEPMPEPEPTPPPVSEEDSAGVEVVEPEPPVVPEPAPVKPENVYYLIKWGDTLWDLAETYYRNPWQYAYIARYNGIRNPNLIIAGRHLVIPAE